MKVQKIVVTYLVTSICINMYHIVYKRLHNLQKALKDGK